MASPVRGSARLSPSSRPRRASALSESCSALSGSYGPQPSSRSRQASALSESCSALSGSQALSLLLRFFLVFSHGWVGGCDKKRASKQPQRYQRGADWGVLLRCKGSPLAPDTWAIIVILPYPAIASYLSVLGSAPTVILYAATSFLAANILTLCFPLTLSRYDILVGQLL